jgi:hypothetical protein
MSQGYPLGNILLAISPTTMAMQEAVNNLLAGVPNEERAWLEALCVLRSFDEERIPELLVAYSGVIPIRDWPYAQVRQARDRLLQTRLVRYLQQTQPETWRRLHCAAYRLYKDWEQHYPDEKQRWQSEVEYHAKCLRDAGYDPDQCV